MNNIDTNSEVKEQKETIILFFKFIKKKVMFIYFMIFLGMGLGLLYSIIKKPIYTASTTFSLQEEPKMGGGGLLSLASSFGLDVGGTNGLFSGNNIELVFKSRKIVEQVMYKKYPHSQKTFGDEYLGIIGLKAKLNLPEEVFAKNFNDIRQQDSLISVIHKQLNSGYMEIVRPDKKYDIYEVSLKSINENFSRTFVNELMNQVSLFYTNTKTKKAKQNVDVLQKRVDSIHAALGDLLYQRASSSILSLNPVYQTGKVVEQYKNLDITALGTGYGELLKNLELSKYTLLKETPLFQIIDEAKFPLKKKTYSPFFYIPLAAFLFFVLSIGILIFTKLCSNFKQLLSSIK